LTRSKSRYQISFSDCLRRGEANDDNGGLRPGQ
jgi:hypothetical protein